MALPSLRSASLLALLAVVGCYSPDCGSFDLDDDLLAGLGDGCAWETSGDPVPTDGEAAVYATLLVTTSPAVVARGAEVSVVARVPGGPEGVSVTSEGGLAIVDVAEPHACGGEGGSDAAGGGDAGAGGDAGGGGPAGGSDGAGGADPGAVSQVRVTFRADDAGALLVTHGAATSRWEPVVLEAASLTLDAGEPATCTVGETCWVRGEVTDAEGVVVYAEEDFTWSTSAGTTTEEHPGTFAFEPEASGTVIVAATVLGLSAEIAIEVQ